jgi:predicted amidophosphoribosyltransferase
VAVSPLLSDLTVGSLLIYPPKGHLSGSQGADRAREVMYQFKSARPDVLKALVAALERHADGVLAQVLGPDVVLVPVPGHAPLPPSAKSHNWASRDIAQAICDAGLGSEVVTAVRRRVKVAKSAFTAPDQRPTAETHYESLIVESDLVLRGAERIALIDDIVTRGATMLAAASRAAEACQGSKVAGFAAMRTARPPSMESLRAIPELERIVYEEDGDRCRRL